jgi:putative transposase
MGTAVLGYWGIAVFGVLGDGAFSVSASQLPETIHSIQNQVEHHRTRTFQQEDLAFLKRHEHSTRCRLLMPGLSFDDKYLWD